MSWEDWHDQEVRELDLKSLKLPPPEISSEIDEKNIA